MKDRYAYFKLTSLSFTYGVTPQRNQIQGVMHKVVPFEMLKYQFLWDKKSVYRILLICDWTVQNKEM